MADETAEESGTMSAGNDEKAPGAKSPPARPPAEQPTPALDFLERLRQHKVAQWTLAYAAGAYTLLHAVEMVSSALSWPHLVISLTTLALLFGFPVVITLAWFHGYRARQRVGGAELAILTVLLALGGGLLWLYGQRDTPAAAASAPPGVVSAAQGPSAAAADERPSIAVLPFENRSRLEDDVFFVDGIHDDILTQLSKASALKVISSTSVDQFRDTRLPTRTIAERLGVGSVLVGGVQRAGNRVRINVQLIDAGTDAHLWADNYDRELTVANIFAIQTEVAVAIAGALKATLTPGEKARLEAMPTGSLDAWKNYQLGRQKLARRTSTSLVEAAELFRKAIGFDPEFALAWSGLSDSLALRTLYGDLPVMAGLDLAQEAADKARELDPGAPDAWASAGLIAMLRKQDGRAQELLLQAIGLNSNHSMALKWYAEVLIDVQRFEEAERHLNKAAALDPLSVSVQWNLGEALEAQERFSDAALHYRRAVDLDPLAPRPYIRLAMLAFGAFHDYVAALPLAQRAAELDQAGPESILLLARLYWDLGDDEALDGELARAERLWPDNAEVLAFLAVRAQWRKDWAGAMRYVNRLMQSEPDHPAALVTLNHMDLRAGRAAAALSRYKASHPELFLPGAPQVDTRNFAVALDVAFAMEQDGKIDQAHALLDGCAQVIARRPLLGLFGRAPLDAQLLVLRGRRAAAIAALREAERAGWRSYWRYYRDSEPMFESIRAEAGFKAVFDDIERDMARQRAEFARRPKHAPLDLDLPR